MKRLTNRLWDAYVVSVRLCRQQDTGNLRSKNAKLANWRRWKRDAEIEAKMPLVQDIARREARRFARHIDLRDLVSAGHVGLVEAANRYHPSAGSFDAFAYWRIKGAIIDSQKRRAFREEQNESLDGIRERYGNWLPPALEKSSAPLQDQRAMESQLLGRLRTAITGLPEPLQSVLRLQLDGRSIAAISRDMGMHHQAVRKLLSDATQRVFAEVRK